jgi:hypothetical protein
LPYRRVTPPSRPLPIGNEDSFQLCSTRCPVKKVAQCQASVWLLPAGMLATHRVTRLEYNLKCIL